VASAAGDRSWQSAAAALDAQGNVHGVPEGAEHDRDEDGQCQRSAGLADDPAAELYRVLATILDRAPE
jgi:hypothetical protein